MDINGLMTIPPYGDDPTFHQSHKWSSECHTCAKGEWLAPASSAVRTKRSWSCGVAKNCASAKAVQFGDPEKMGVAPLCFEEHPWILQTNHIQYIQYKYNYVYVIEIYRTSIILNGRGSKKDMDHSAVIHTYRSVTCDMDQVHGSWP